MPLRTRVGGMRGSNPCTPWTRSSPRPDQVWLDTHHGSGPGQEEVLAEQHREAPGACTPCPPCSPPALPPSGRPFPCVSPLQRGVLEWSPSLHCVILRSQRSRAAQSEQVLQTAPRVSVLTS